MALALVAAQLAVGGGVLALAWRYTSGGGPRASSRREASWDLIRAAPFGAAVVVVLELLAWVAGAPSPGASVLAGSARDARWLYLLGGLATVPGCYLAIAAGHAERRGELGAARREVRLAGFVTACGACVQALSSLASLVAAGISSAQALPLGTSLATIAAAGFAGLLGGLSGKPRPTAYVSAALAVVSTLAWLAAR